MLNSRKYCFDAFICRGRLWLYSSAGRLKTFRPVFSGQAKDTLAGTVGLLYKQSGLKDTINGFTRMGGATWLAFDSRQAAFISFERLYAICSSGMCDSTVVYPSECFLS